MSGCGGEKPPPPPARAPGRAERLKAPLPKPNGLNLIVIVADTWRTDYLGVYGGRKVPTPHLDRFAAEGVLFENAYADSLPTLPTRRVWQAGRSLLADKDPWWAAHDPEAVTIAEVLSKAGYYTGLIADTFHYFKPGMNFHQGYQTFEWIRGQESDAWIAGTHRFDPSSHMPSHLVNEKYMAAMQQYMANTSGRKSEDDYFCAQTTAAAIRWLELRDARQPFFLWVDMFDPHEPWDAPPRFQKMVRPDYGYDRFLFGYGVRNEDIRESDYAVIRDLYAAEAAFSDFIIGRLLAKIDALGLRDDSIVVFASDHGTHLGELGCVQKTAGLCNSAIAHVPLIVRHPDRRFAGKRVRELVGAADYMPTFLSLLGIEGFPGLDGKNFWSLTAGGRNHERIFFGYGNFAAVRDQRWHYFQHFRGADPGKGPALYDLEADPAEEHNVVENHPDVVDERRALIADRFQAELPAATPPRAG